MRRELCLFWSNRTRYWLSLCRSKLIKGDFAHLDKYNDEIRQALVQVMKAAGTWDQTLQDPLCTDVEEAWLLEPPSLELAEQYVPRWRNLLWDWHRW